MRLPDPIALSKADAYLAYKAGILEAGDLKPNLSSPLNDYEAWLAYWVGITSDYPKNEDGSPRCLMDETALIAYLAGVNPDYPYAISRPDRPRIAQYLRYCISARWGQPENPLNREEFYLSLLGQTLPWIDSGSPSANITISNTAAAPFGLVEMYGDTEQQTYAGKNLIPFPYSWGGNGQGITMTYDSAGVITLNGKNNGSSNSYRYLVSTANPITLPPGTYYFIHPPEDTISFVLQSGDTYLGFSKNNDWSRTLDSEVTGAFYIQVLSGSATQFDNTKVYPMLSVTPGQTVDDYEPYTGGIPSPSPDNPQEIKTVSGHQEVEIDGGKNLLNIADATGSRGSNSVTASNQVIKLDTLADYGTEMSFYLDEVSRTGQWLADNSASARDYNVTTNGGTYVWGVYISALPTSAIIFQLATNQRLFRLAKNDFVNNYAEVSISLRDDEYIKSVQFYTAAYNVFSNFQIFSQIELGSESTSYQPHHHLNYPVDLDPSYIALAQSGSVTVNGVTVTALGGGRYNFNGTASDRGYVGVWGDTVSNNLGDNNPIITQLLPNTQYRMRNTLVSGTVSGSSYYPTFVGQFSKNNTVVYCGRGGTETFTTTSEGQGFVRAYTRYESGQVFDNLILQFDFEQVGATPITLAKVGDYQDVIFRNNENSPFYDSNIADGVWAVRKETISYQIKNTDIFGRYQKVYQAAKTSFPNALLPVDTTQMFSSHFAVTDSWDVVNGAVPGKIYAGGVNININYDGTGDNIDGFKSWLVDNKVELLAPRSAVATTAITDTRLISQLDALEAGGSADGSTTITVTAEDPNLPGLLHVKVSRYEIE